MKTSYEKLVDLFRERGDTKSLQKLQEKLGRLPEQRREEFAEFYLLAHEGTKAGIPLSVFKPKLQQLIDGKKVEKN